jgi:hypothetical protein
VIPGWGSIKTIKATAFGRIKKKINRLQASLGGVKVDCLVLLGVPHWGLVRFAH